MTKMKSWTDASRRGDFEAIPEAVMIQQDSVVDVAEDPPCFLSLAVESDLPQIVGKAKAWYTQIG
jgi:hypothetical protein